MEFLVSCPSYTSPPLTFSHCERQQQQTKNSEGASVDNRLRGVLHCIGENFLGSRSVRKAGKFQLKKIGLSFFRNSFMKVCTKANEVF